MATIADDEQSTTLEDVKQLGFFAAIGSLGYVFWIVGGMEMIERLAYYGVKAVAALYATAPSAEGGLGASPTQFGILLFVWAMIQTGVSALTGGLSDRYGYKQTIFASTIIKILGYLIMAWIPTYAGFFAGAIVLATGTAVFKPGIQGTLVRSTNRRNSSIAWGIFYQTVNIGGWIGPLLASYLRTNLAWTYVFYACAAIISLNFLMLLTYREVGKEERLERARLQKEGKLERRSLAVESLHELAKPHVWVYLLVFSGFWFMFNSLFDVLPLHIRDWVSTSDVIRTLSPSGHVDSRVIRFLLGMNEDGTAIQPEGMLNLNAALIMVTCFVVAGISAKMRATTSMFIGTFLSSIALFASGYSTLGWISVGAIAIFSIGEMLSSPKFSEFIGNFAPNDKKAMYLGFSQIPLAIGWSLEAISGPVLYDFFSSKDRFSRELLIERVQAGQVAPPTGEALTELAKKLEMAPDALASLFPQDAVAVVTKIPQGEGFDWLVRLTGGDAQTLTNLLHQSHNVGLVWYIMGGVGIATTIGIWIYGRWIRTLKTT